MTNQQQQKLLEEVEGLPEDMLPNLIEIVRLFKASVFQAQQEVLALQAEFAAWDQLSDEALQGFEKGL
jgi:hypothetical protein